MSKLWMLAVLIAFLMVAAAFAQAPVGDPFAALSEVTRLKVENLALKEHSLQRDLQIVLAQINYQARQTDLQKQRERVEVEVVVGLGGDPTTQRVEWTTGALVPKGR